MEPSKLIRKIFPSKAVTSCAKEGCVASPTVAYSFPSGPIFKRPHDDMYHSLFDQ